MNQGLKNIASVCFSTFLVTQSVSGLECSQTKSPVFEIKELIGEMPSAEVSEFANKMRGLNHKACKDRLWPDLKLGQFPIFIADGKNQKVWQVELNSAKDFSLKSRPDLHEKNESLFKGHFQKILEPDGYLGLAVSLRQPHPQG